MSMSNAITCQYSSIFMSNIQHNSDFTQQYYSLQQYLYVYIYKYIYICTYKENSNYSLTNRIGIATVTVASRTDRNSLGRFRRLPNVVDAEANLNISVVFRTENDNEGWC